MNFRNVLAAIAVVLTLAGCANDGSGPGTKQTIGGLGGAVLGGLLGAQFGSGSGQAVAIGAGVLIGALVGSELGNDLDEADQRRADKAVSKAHTAPIGETVAWNNPDSGNYGTVTPVRDGTSSSGEYCREFQQTIVVNGETQQGYGIACRMEDGSWRIKQ